MKLLELTRSYYPSIGGMEKFVYDRTKIYNGLDISYDILSTDFTTGKIDHQIQNQKVRYLKQYTPYNYIPGYSKYLTDEYDYISVNLLGRYYSDYAINHYVKKRQKIILTPYFTYHTSKYLLPKKIVETLLYPQLLKKVDAVIAFTEYEKQYWCKRYNVAFGKIFVIPPFISLDKKPNMENELSEDGKYLLYIGRSGSNKLTDLLLKAFLQLQTESLSLILTIRLEDVAIGIRSIVAGNKKIKLLGYVNEEEKQKLITHAEALIFPTSWESFGYVAFEAAALHKPILCSDIPVLRELHGKGGTIFFKNDVKSIFNAIFEFMNYSKSKKDEMGVLNYSRVSGFSFENSYSKYKEMFSLIDRQ